MTNLAEANRFADAPNTPMGYEIKIVVFKPSETDATLACVHFHGHEGSVQCHGHFCLTSLKSLC